MERSEYIYLQFICSKGNLCEMIFIENVGRRSFTILNVKLRKDR